MTLIRNTAPKKSGKRKGVVHPRLPYANVDVTASSQDRVNTLSALMDVVVADTDTTDTAANAKHFLLLTAWHEGAQLTARVQAANGPAMSFFQIEAPTAQTASTSNYMTDTIRQKLADCGGYTVDNLNTAFANLGTTAYFPSGNLVGTALSSIDIFGCYLARIVLRTRPDPIPDPDPTYAAEAAYWFKNWHGNAGDSDTLQAQFIQDCQLMSPYLSTSTDLRHKRSRR